MTTLGSRLRDARRERGLTQQDLAVRAGLAIRSVAAYEADETVPGADQLRKLCEALPASSDLLLGLVSHPPTVGSAAPAGEG